MTSQSYYWGFPGFEKQFILEIIERRGWRKRRVVYWVHSFRFYSMSIHNTAELYAYLKVVSMTIQWAKTRPEADCGSSHELLIGKFRLKLKKVGKTTRPFRYDLNQIPYDYKMEVRTRFKGLDLIDRVPDELWTEICDIVQETGIPKKMKCKKAKWLSEEVLQIAVKRKEAKSKGEKERYEHLNAEFQRISRRDKKAFLCSQCK